MNRNYDDAYVKQLEAENAKLMERMETLQTSYDVMGKYFVLSVLTDAKGIKLHSINVRSQNMGIICEKEYNALALLGIECEPHVDMRESFAKQEGDTIAELNKAIDEAFEKKW